MKHVERKLDDTSGSRGMRYNLTPYPITVTIDVRWGEMDAFGHVNNVHYFRYFEVARFAYLDAIGFSESTGIGPILASTNCRFRKPLGYPDQLLAAARTTRIQEERFTHHYVLLSERLQDVVAEGMGVIVSYDYDAAVKVPLPGEIHRRIQELEASDV